MERLNPSRLWTKFKPPSRAARHRLAWSQQGLWVYRIILALAAVGLMTYVSPFQRPYNIGEFRIGSVAKERVIAPFLFYVRKSDEELSRERLEAERSVPTLLRMRPEVKVIQLTHLDSVFRVLFANIRMQMPDSLKYRRLQRALPGIIGTLSVSARDQLVQGFAATSPEHVQAFQESAHLLLADLYTGGILHSKNEILTGITSAVVIDARDTTTAEVLHSAEELKRGGLLPYISSYGSLLERVGPDAVYELLSLFIEPNLYIDYAETGRLRAEARHSVARIKDQYVKDELIIDKNTRVTARHVEALNALAEQIATQERADSTKRLLQALAAAAVAGFLVIVFGFYLASREPAYFTQPGSMLLLALLFTATAAVAAYFKTNELAPYLVPIPLAAMLVTILFNPQIGLMFSFLAAIFAGNLYGDINLALVGSLTAAVAVYSVRQVRHRNQFYRAMILLPLSYSLLIGATDLLRFVPLDEIYQDILPGIVIGIAAPILTIGLLPIFESLFQITTDITLLELSDQNRPLLRNLAMRAPGTYTHSLNMANLSEAAAEAIKANPLLARVGCYYHDIGKMLKPEYFAENQGLLGGRNPHDHLTPTMSMLIIASHVKDGLELAEEYGLPKAICDLIPQHHGTTVIEYFYNRAIELGVENVRQDDFRYDGPRPQNKVAGILMLADSVESAARTLAERTPSRVRQLVRNIIQQKFTTGELDECDLTLQDLNKIEESFVPVLMGTLHERVEYPWQKAERKARKRLGDRQHSES